MRSGRAEMPDYPYWLRISPVPAEADWHGRKVLIFRGEKAHLGIRSANCSSHKKMDIIAALCIFNSHNMQNSKLPENQPEKELFTWT